MKNLLLNFLIVIIALPGFTQKRPEFSKEWRNYAVKNTQQIEQNSDVVKTLPLPSYKSSPNVEEQEIGGTRYDLQSNSSCQNRLVYYPDGTIGATWTMGFDDPNFADRGTGYNYFDGNNWGTNPTSRIESIRTGWPSYAPYGNNGELVVSHDFAAGTLLYLTRTEKGTGSWSENVLAGPASQKISWPRAITSGVNNSVMQVLSITWPVANGGTVYEGLDGALLYSRSSDGGTTWDPENMILDGLDANYFYGITADDYDWAVQGDNIAFVVGTSWTDLVLMKSTDNGDSWNKTVIWENPYPLYNIATPTPTDTFYCADGDHHLAFDNTGMVHVVFGINRAVADAAGTYWFPLVDGLGYWNESRPTFSNNMNALNPYGEAGTELVDNYSLIGWSQDINGNGTWDILGSVGSYYVGASSMPQITIDNQNHIFVVYASVTESYNNGTQDYRHLWERTSLDLGDNWGDFIDLDADLIHIFDECVFPSIASASDDYIYLIYQTDNEPGLAVRGDLDPYGDNKIQFMKVDKADLVGINEQKVLDEGDVSQNSPNPFSGSSKINVNLHRAANLSLKVTNTMGQTVYLLDGRLGQPGMNTLTIDGSKLSTGVYFYTVKAGDQTVTKKMIIE